jgi:hypothetical protein
VRETLHGAPSSSSRRLGAAAGRPRLLLVALTAGAACLLLLPACNNLAGDESGREHGASKAAARAAETALPVEDIQVPRPPFSEGIFPCSECHKDIKPNLTVRTLTDAHDDILLKHGRDRWCFDCHNPDNRDVLRLASGKLVDFSQSYLLCGQCHGDKFRDWRVGVHGKRTGEWSGRKQYLLCVNCHNPHSPHFKALKPLPPPNKPQRTATLEGGRP